MAENKTKPSDADVAGFLEHVEQKRRRADSFTLLDVFERATAMKPCLWGSNIVGYGQYFYKYQSGHSGNFPLTGFSPRKASMSIYIMPGFKQYQDQLKRLGKHKHSVSCLYLTRLDLVNLAVLEEIISDSVERMKALNPDWCSFPKLV